MFHIFYSDKVAIAKDSYLSYRFRLYYYFFNVAASCHMPGNKLCNSDNANGTPSVSMSSPIPSEKEVFCLCHEFRVPSRCEDACHWPKIPELWQRWSAHVPKRWQQRAVISGTADHCVCPGERWATRAALSETGCTAVAFLSAARLCSFLACENKGLSFGCWKLKMIQSISV